MSTFEHFDLMVRNFFDQTSEFKSALDSRIQYPVDIYETKDGICFEIAAIGADKSDIELNTQGDQLRVTYRKEPETSNQVYVKKGIAKRSFDFGWRLASKFDLTKTTAKLDKGLLRIVVPYLEQESPKSVTIK